MSIESVISSLKSFGESPNAFYFFEAFSRSVWNRIRFVWESSGMKIYETTITQNLIFDLVVQDELGHFPVKIFESMDEKSNGSDMEVFIEIDEGFYLIACQAKIINRNLKYPKVRHQVNGKEQIDLLIAYAKREKGIPAYLLYNYCDDFITNFNLANHCSINPDSFGCTIANAKFVKDLCFNQHRKSGFKAPGFIDIHPEHAIPIQYLVPSHIQIECLRKILNAGGEDLGIYTEEQVMDRQHWKEAIPRGAYGDPMVAEAIQRKELPFSENAPHRFNPKFKIVFHR